MIFPSISSEHSFKIWLKDFKKHALKNNISEDTFNKSMSHVVFLPKVIKYDRFQPEFYEDTQTYISKRTSQQKVKEGKNLYKKHKEFINLIDNSFFVEKELLLSLMGIETNFGTYVGKMDILSSLATLSFDKRRSDFFTNELITILKLIEADVIDLAILKSANVVTKNTLQVKVMLSGTIGKAINLKGIKVSKGALEAITAAGGKIED